jgi:hypothetical protein
MTGAWRLKKTISMLKPCHPEICPSAGEGPFMKSKSNFFSKIISLLIFRIVKLMHTILILIRMKVYSFFLIT